MQADVKKALEILNSVSESGEVTLVNFKYSEYLNDESLGIMGRNEI